MTVTIRLARLGCRNHPFYRVVVADSTCARDGKNLEVLGFYNPISGKDEEKRMALKFERVNLLETYVKYGKTLHIGGIVLIAAT